MKYVDISLDLETWGKKYGYDARSIGACEFDLETGLIIGDTFYTACDNPKVYISGNPDNEESYGFKYDLKRDPDTVDWWSRQPAEAQAAFNDPVDLKIALELLTDFIVLKARKFKDGQAIDVRIWSHGAAFDPPIVDGLYDAVGLKLPWFYRAPRDTRTAFDFAGIDDHSAWLQKHNRGILHHALYDSLSQAVAICMSYSRIRIVD